MDWIFTMQKAIDYLEEHIIQELDYQEIAKQACVSVYHFQRIFGILCGCTLGEYIRNRRLSLAGEELQSSQVKILELALKYGYDSSESFSRAFRKFHGVNPSDARKNRVMLKVFNPVSFNLTVKGGEEMSYRIEKTNTMYFLGYKKHFEGVPSNRGEQEQDFFIHTRLQQFALDGLTKDCETRYTLITNVDDSGYDFYIAARYGQADSWMTQERYDSIVKLNPEIGQMFQKIVVSPATYVVFQTERCDYPTEIQEKLRKKIVSEWLPGSGFELADGFEMTVSHWFMGEKREKRYIELWMPVQRK